MGQQKDHELELAATHEASHVVVNAVKGRLFSCVELWEHREQSSRWWAGMTVFALRSVPREDAEWTWGLIGHGTVVTEAAPSQELGLEDELTTLASGVVGESKQAAQLGLADQADLWEC